MLSQHLAKGPVQNMCCSVVSASRVTNSYINRRLYLLAELKNSTSHLACMFSQTRQCKRCVNYSCFARCGCKNTRITDLTTTFSIKSSDIEENLYGVNTIRRVTHNRQYSEHRASCICCFISDECRRAMLLHHGPITLNR